MKNASNSIINPKDTAEDIAYRKIKIAFNKRYIKSGKQLKETALAKKLNVSRTPIRGAIKRLVYEGFVKIYPNKGAFVIEPSISDIRQTFAVRANIEEMSAFQAALHITDEQIDELYRLIDDEIQLFDAREMEYYQTNDAIHLAIAKASKNFILTHYVKDILNRTNIYLVLFDPFFKRVINPSEAEHLKIVQYLKKRDPKNAARMMVNHLETVFEELNLDQLEILPEDYIDL